MKAIIGEVISAKMTKTATVLFKRFYRYPLYGKIVARKSKIHARNEIGAVAGDKVAIVPCRPLAKTVAFTITKVITKSTISDVKSVIKVDSKTSKAKVNQKTKNKKQKANKQVI